MKPEPILGYWVLTGTRRPDYEPSDAMLPRLGGPAGEAGDYLCLVQRGAAWFAVSEAAAITYRYYREMSESACWVFVDTNGQVWRATPADAIGEASVKRLYGWAEHLRPERKYLQIHLEKT